MKLKNLLFVGLASAVLFAGCKKDEIQESPSLTINEDSASLQFSAQGGESETQTITFTANRSWTATCDADWVHMDPVDGPASSDPQTLTVYVDQNDGFVRSATITLTAGGVVDKPVAVSQEGKDINYTSIADLRAMAKDTETPVKIEGSVFIKGVVISDKDELNNISEKNVFIQDETAGIQLRFASAGTYSRGDELSINATGLTIAFYGDMYQLVASSDGENSTGMPATAVTRLSEDNEIVAKQITIQDFLGLKYESQYVEITTPVQVSEEDMGKTFIVGDEHTNIKFTDADYNTFVVRSEKYSDLLKETDVPEGSGHIKGIATRFGATPQIVFSTVSDWAGLTDPRFDVDAPDPAPDNAVYYNDFDKEAATESYGSTGDKWPYLDQFEGWKNETGTGVENVSYDYSGASARNNSNTDGSYSDYPGSGLNNILFGSDAYLQINNITVDAQNYTLSFGTEKYAYGVSDNTFKPEEFHVYISDNGERWVELEYAFPNGFKNGRWDLASSTFTIPSGTSALYIYFASDLSGAHRLDDVALAPAESAGTEIDFSKGTAIGGGDEPGPVEVLTVEEFLAKPEGDTYYQLTGTVANISNTYFGNFDLIDETGSVYVYGLVSSEGAADGTFESLGLKEGDVVTIAGRRASHNGSAQVGDAYYISHVEGQLPEIKNVSVTEFLSSPVSDLQKYRLTGRIDNIVNTSYGNFDLVDETGTVYVYGLKANESASNQSFSELGLKEGDVVTLVGTRGEHNGDPQVANAYYESHVEGLSFSVSPASLSASAEAGTAKFTVTASDEVSWTVSTASDFVTLSDQSGTGTKEIEVTYTANDGADSRTAEITVSTTADVPTKSYTVVLTQNAAGAVDPSTPPFTSSITWTLGSQAYDNTSSGNSKQSATINGESVDNLLKLGSSSKAGTATLHIPAGVSRVGFYAVCWKGQTTEIEFSGATVSPVPVNDNTGATGNPPYTMTVTEDDYYVIDVNTSEALDLGVTASKRIVIWGINPVE